MSAGYDPSHFADLVAVEDRHFWFRARNRIISSLATRAAAGFPAGYRVLEIGCGDGNVLRFLEKACPGGMVVGMDYFAEGLRYARQRTLCSLVQGDMARPPFGKPFHLIGMFDVLEHIRDDGAALRDVRRILDGNGKLLLTVPAHTSLWSAFDEASGHCRRYERDELARKLEEAGFEIQFITPFMASIYPLVWMTRTRGHARGPAQASVRHDLRVRPVVNELLYSLLLPETWWLARQKTLPVGTSLLAIAGRT